MKSVSSLTHKKALTQNGAFARNAVALSSSRICAMSQDVHEKRHVGGQLRRATGALASITG